MDKLKEFGIYLAKKREKSGYKSQRQLAIAAGVSPATLSRIESGIQEPKPETLKALSRFLKDTDYKELMEKAGYIDQSKGENGEIDKLRKELMDEFKKLSIEDQEYVVGLIKKIRKE